MNWGQILGADSGGLTDICFTNNSDQFILLLQYCFDFIHIVNENLIGVVSPSDVATDKSALLIDQHQHNTYAIDTYSTPAQLVTEEHQMREGECTHNRHGRIQTEYRQILNKYTV